MKVQVAIIGGGPAGMSAAIWCKRLNISHILLEENAVLGAQLASIHNAIIDYPGLVTKNGEQFRQALVKHVEELGCTVESGVKIVHLDSGNLEIRYQQHGRTVTLGAESMILATGTSPRKLLIPGEQEMLDRGETYSASKDAGRFAGRRVAVVGGGDRALEGALLLSKHCSKVYVIHRSHHFRARSDYIREAEQTNNIVMLKNCVLERIQGNDRVENIMFRNLETNEVETIQVDGVLIRIGVQSNIPLIQEKVKTDPEGYIMTDAYGQTNIPGIFAIGDVCTPPLYSSLSNAIGQGMVSVKYIHSHILRR
ncbi:NAD(P)/FAD-dependent oxidoreductase [Paenibacillus chartarius]|uniref:NAD(P)/FAD-dependent oxidoreductase n=1 Tax=Paenibacillus chartarius TaxID=747481 RepID=A0ABV6DKE4_9BACL